MWDNIEYGFQIAFTEAWEAYTDGTIPIGSVILDTNNKIVSKGRNQIYKESTGLIKFHQLAHAETNAILHLSEITNEDIHKNIRKYTLYTTMEPCPFCFGAIVMGSIRNLKFGARDNYAGATALNSTIDYIRNKKIFINGPFEKLELVQIVIQTCYELQRGTHYDVLMSSWQEICREGVFIGKMLFDEGILNNFKACQTPFGEVYDYIVSQVKIQG